MTMFSCPKCGARQELASVSRSIDIYGDPRCTYCGKSLPRSLLLDVDAADKRAKEAERASVRAVLGV